MKKSISMVWGVSVLIVVLLALGLFVVAPALAQEEVVSTEVGTTTESVELIGSGATSTDASISTSTPAEAAPEDAKPDTIAEAPPTEPTPEVLGVSTESSLVASTSTPIETAAPTKAPPEGLTEVHIIGTKYTDYFTDGTTITAYPGDPTIGGNLDKPNTPIPAREGLTWVNTTGTYLYDTPSGDLEVGQYAVLASGGYIGKPLASSTSTPATISPLETASSPTTPSTEPTPSVLGASTSTPDTSPDITATSTTGVDSNKTPSDTSSSSTTTDTASTSSDQSDAVDPTTNSSATTTS